MKASVVMATFNGSKFIREQLESILNQSTQIDELIVSDDGSTDDTIQILEEYQSKYPDVIHVCQNEKTKGYAGNFWSAIAKATNEIVILSDQDDIWDKNKVEIVLKLFQDSSDMLTLNFGYRIVDERGTEVKDIKFKHFKDKGSLKKVSFHEFVRAPKYPGMSMAFKKSLYDKICNVDSKLLTAHDWMLNQAAAKECGMYFCDKIVTSYRQHGSNTFGVNATFSKEKLFGRRVDVIKEVVMNYEHLLAIYGGEDIFLKKIKKAGQKRLRLFQSKNLLGIITHYIMNMKYIAFRDFCGDVYVLLKR